MVEEIFKKFYFSGHLVVAWSISGTSTTTKQANAMARGHFVPYSSEATLIPSGESSSTENTSYSDSITRLTSSSNQAHLYCFNPGENLLRYTWVRVKISNSKISEWLIFRIRKIANVQM